MDKRYHKVEWGPHGARKRTSEANWKQPLRWARAARASGRRPKVFCSSLADVFDNQVPPEWRVDLFHLIIETPELDWLILTKRPENISKLSPWVYRQIPPNIWLGTTCENQAAYDRRWPILREIPASIRFISYEPALGDLWLPGGDVQPDWLICGGESGSGYREMPPEWAIHAAIQCESLGIAFFMKQMAGRKLIPADLMIREFPQNKLETSYIVG